MLKPVAQGLKYVKDIRPGDTIPRELLDGTASWSIDKDTALSPGTSYWFQSRRLAVARKRPTACATSRPLGRLVSFYRLMA